ncbi:MAG TPA: hypothetical protein VFS93_08205, partial [Terrimesophilobacter sp.]|nr:hypothetical protein [Terrimesophilobacter sp.]
MRTITQKIALACALVLPLSACSLSTDNGPKGVEQDPESGITLLVHPTIYSALGGDDFVKE